jgi:DNA-binding NarL/FixJ family response regulator
VRFTNEVYLAPQWKCQLGEVLQLLAEGNPSKKIAKKLGICAKTVESHRSELMLALDIHDIAGLVRYAIRMGVISAEE